VPSHVFYVRHNGKAVWTGNCSAHGQKGVVGMIISQENMPFTKEGIVPDLIINPHAFPSRMTIGHLVETVMAKVCCLEGVTGDGTVFIPFDKEELYNNLESHNYQRHGNEILYNGRTGEQIKSEIFIGPIFYYRLKHMVADKIHSRSTGAKTQLTHQPTSGRSAGGGLRVGEMERDVLIGHGIAQFTKECMMEKSDKYKWAVCRHCGTVAVFTPHKSIVKCTGCKKQDVSVVETPYSLKLLIQELECMGVQLRLTTGQKPRADTNDDAYNDSDDDNDSDERPAPDVYDIAERAYPDPVPVPAPPQAVEPKPDTMYEEDDVDEVDDMFEGGSDDGAELILNTFEGGGSDSYSDLDLESFGGDDDPQVQSHETAAFTPQSQATEIAAFPPQIQSPPIIHGGDANANGGTSEVKTIYVDMHGGNANVPLASGRKRDVDGQYQEKIENDIYQGRIKAEVDAANKKTKDMGLICEGMKDTINMSPEACKMAFA